MGNIHFTEILDFIVGWAGYDLTSDDWATRIREEQKALNGLEDGRPAEPKEPPKAPPEGPATKPPEEPPKKPPVEPPRKEAPKPPPKKPTPRDLRDIIP